MGKALEQPRFDRAAFLDWEAAQDGKNEYVAGEVFAMVGARQQHVVVAGSLYARFREHLKGTRCRAYVSDMKLEVAAADAVFYPDVMVSCDEADRRAELALQAPCLVVEVLSDSTAATDRGAKFAAYRQLPSLQDYLLVDIDARRLELFGREAGGWLLHESTPAQPSVQLRSIALTLTVGEAFGDLDEVAGQG
ncbi:MAG: Uma2 family endonuclease [Rubrivivax sp.]